MLRLVVIWGSFALTIACAVMAKVARWGEPAFFFLALGGIFLVVFLFALSTREKSASAEKGPSLMRIGRLWLQNKERELESRLQSKP